MWTPSEWDLNGKSKKTYIKRKICSWCNEKLPLSMFRNYSSLKTNSSKCRKCREEINKRKYNEADRSINL